MKLPCHALGLFGATVIFMASDSLALESVSPAVSDVATIEDGRGHTRILFRWSPVVEAEHYAVRRAVLKFDLAGEADARKLEVAVYPLTKTWSSGSLTWAEGADYDEESEARATIDFTRSEAVIDVTAAVKEILEEKRTSHGYVLTLAPEAGDGIATSDLTRLSGLTNARVELSYRKTPPPPPQVVREPADEAGGR